MGCLGSSSQVFGELYPGHVAKESGRVVVWRCGGSGACTGYSSAAAGFARGGSNVRRRCAAARGEWQNGGGTARPGAAERRHAAARVHGPLGVRPFFMTPSLCASRPVADAVLFTRRFSRITSALHVAVWGSDTRACYDQAPASMHKRRTASDLAPPTNASSAAKLAPRQEQQAVPSMDGHPRHQSQRRGRRKGRASLEVLGIQLDVVHPDSRCPWLLHGGDGGMQQPTLIEPCAPGLGAAGGAEQTGVRGTPGRPPATCARSASPGRRYWRVQQGSGAHVLDAAVF